MTVRIINNQNIKTKYIYMPGYAKIYKEMKNKVIVIGNKEFAVLDLVT